MKISNCLINNIKGIMKKAVQLYGIAFFEYYFVKFSIDNL